MIGLFKLSEQATIYCTAHLRAIAFINIILAMYIPLFGVFQGANHGAAATVVVTFALTMRVLTTYLFRYNDLFGYTIIWWNGLFGFGAGFLIAWGYYLSGRWQKNAAIQINQPIKLGGNSHEKDDHGRGRRQGSGKWRCREIRGQ